MTASAYYYALYWHGLHGEWPNSAVVVGIYSTLEKAKTEGQRYHRRTPLVWKECTSDSSPKTPDYWFAPLTDWAMPTEIAIQRKKLDGKKFR